MALAIQYQLETSQWWSPEQLAAQQYKQLTRLIHHASKHSAFYRKRFQDSGINKHTRITAESIAKIPILKRETLQQVGKTIHSHQLPNGHGNRHLIQTSGSTGRPISVYGSDLTRFFWQAFTLRDHHWHQRDFSGKLAAIRWAKKDQAMPPKGLLRKGWGASTEHSFITGPSMMLNSASDISDQLTWLKKNDPHYLVSHPSNLVALASYAISQGVELKNLRGITTVGEVVTNKVRQACLDAWGITVADFYTCQEAGYLAIQCPENQHYHVQSENVFLEVINDSGQPCKPGEVGRVLITSLNNFATPLIRYELGDYAEVGSLCTCGRGLPVLNKVMRSI